MSSCVWSLFLTIYTSLPEYIEPSSDVPDVTLFILLPLASETPAIELPLTDIISIDESFKLTIETSFVSTSEPLTRLIIVVVLKS